MGGVARAGESGQVESARAWVSVGLSDGGSVEDAARRILDRHSFRPDASVVAVDVEGDLSTAQIRVGIAETKDESGLEQVPVHALGDGVLRHRPQAVALHLSTERAAFDCLARIIATWLEAGVPVAIVAGDARVRDTVLVKFAGLNPRVELHSRSTHAAAWAVLTNHVGELISPHRPVVEDVIGANASLALLFATALEPWLGQDSVPAEAVEEALRTALARQVLGIAGDEVEAAFAFVHVVIGASATVDSAADTLGLCPERAGALRRALIEAGFGVGAFRRRELAVPGLLRLMPVTTTRRAVVALRELLVEAELDPDSCLAALSAVHREGQDDLIRLVHDTVRSVPQSQRAAMLAALLPALAARPTDPVRAVVDRVRGRRVDALRVPIKVAAEGERLEDPLQGGSLLVALEHPREVASWADRALGEHDCDEDTWLRAALARTVVGGSSPDHPGPLAITRRPGLSPRSAELLGQVETAMSSLTMVARECDVLAIAGQADDLALDDWPADVGCLVAGACLAIDQYDLADRWTWLVRAQTEPDSIDHGYAQLLKSYCEISRGDMVRAKQNALAARHTLDGCGAVALAAVAAVTAALCHSRGNRPAAPPIRGDAHAFLVGIHHYFAAQISIEEDPGVDVVNVFFEVGRRLRAAGLDNPGLLRWREHLVRLFEEKDEPQIAQVLRTDLLRAEAQWAVHNPRSAASRQATASLGLPPVFVAGGQGLGAISCSEMRVVERVVAGDTNPQAAAALCLSKRTVDTHLRNVYRRLGITSREELRDLVQSATPAPGEDR